MSNINVAEYVVRNGSSIDVEASVAKFRSALDVHVAERETELSVIAEAVHAVFDKNRGDAIAMPTLTGLTLQNMNAQPSNFGTLTERVQDYIRSSSKGDKPTFVITKGKGGGVRRASDIPAKQ